MFLNSHPHWCLIIKYAFHLQTTLWSQIYIDMDFSFIFKKKWYLSWKYSLLNDFKENFHPTRLRQKQVYLNK